MVTPSEAISTSAPTKSCQNSGCSGLMEEFVGDAPTISYVGIRGDEDREGYVSTKPNIQSIFPFRRNIWSLDVINRLFQNKNRPLLEKLCREFCPAEYLNDFLKVVETPTSKAFYFSKKTNTLLDISVKTFNRKLANVDVRKWLGFFLSHIHDYNTDYSSDLSELFPYNLRKAEIL